jgi:predicted nucleotidyltransferase component of viral defense system
MSAPENFSKLVNMAMAGSGHGHMRPVIEKELLHYDILFSLDREGLLDPLTFQGGTCLRLCYGSTRSSEDLYFVGGLDFNSRRLMSMKDCLEQYIGRRYELEVDVKEPRDLRNEPEYARLNIDKWRISVTTAPGQRHLPRQRIKIEVASIPAYSRVPRSLLTNYDFLPDGYGDILNRYRN